MIEEKSREKKGKEGKGKREKKKEIAPVMFARMKNIFYSKHSLLLSGQVKPVEHPV